MKNTYKVAVTSLLVTIFCGNASALENRESGVTWDDAENCLSSGVGETCKTIKAKILDIKYQAAVTDAVTAEEKEKANNLLAINPENNQLVWNESGTKLLVVTWKATGAYENFLKPYTATSDNEEYVTWVTLAPQVQDFCSNFLENSSRNAKEDLDVRLKQYHGLNASWGYDVFVELWVSPEDLFRPCVDPETNDAACELDFGKTTPVVKNIKDYKEFYKNLYYKSFRSSAPVPWTGLGYTYDWGNRHSEVGASEFILVPNAPYEIGRVIPTMDYCTHNY